MAEARDRELESRELCQAPLPLRQVLIHRAEPQAEGVRGRIDRDEYPAVLQPQKDQLPLAVTRDVDRLEGLNSRWSIRRPALREKAPRA